MCIRENPEVEMRLCFNSLARTFIFISKYVSGCSGADPGFLDRGFKFTMGIQFVNFT